MAPSLPAAGPYPLYMTIDGHLSVVGAARSLYFYWPDRNKILMISQARQRRAPCCNGLSSQFNDGPGDLAKASENDTYRSEQSWKKRILDGAVDDAGRHREPGAAPLDVFYATLGVFDAYVRPRPKATGTRQMTCMF